MILFFVFGIFGAFMLLKYVFKMFMPNLINFVMKTVHSHLVSMKAKHFQEAFEQIKSSGKNSKLEILEIGIGTGENFKYYPQNANLTILDKTDMFMPFLNESIKRNARQDLTVSKLVLNRGENMKDIASNSFDAVVHTFILCSVDDYTKVLKEIYRVLKPGGVCIFIEHSVDNENVVRRTLQKAIQPLLGDCKFLDMKKVLSSGCYDKLNLKKHQVSIRFLDFINPMVYGFAEKTA